MTAFARENGFTDDELCLWDVPFWSERQSEAKFGFEEEELRPYFALPNVLDGLFSLCSRIFDVKIVESKETVAKWHEDVKYFDVLDGQASAKSAAPGCPPPSLLLPPHAAPSGLRPWLASRYLLPQPPPVLIGPLADGRGHRQLLPRPIRAASHEARWRVDGLSLRAFGGPEPQACRLSDVQRLTADWQQACVDDFL